MPSDTNLFFSGRNEARWVDEEDQIMALVTEQNAQEHEEADNLISNDVPEVFEWKQLIDRTDDDPPVPITVTITVDVKKIKVQELTTIFQKLGVILPHAKRNQSLHKMLQDPSEVTKMDEDSFSYEAEMMLPRQEEGSRLEILSGCDHKLPPGFNRSGTEIGKFAPANGENMPGAQKKSYLMEQPDKIN